MTRQATMPSSSEKCLHVSKTESYGLSRICFEMTRQATMPSSKAWLCLALKLPRIAQNCYIIASSSQWKLVKSFRLLHRWHFFVSCHVTEGGAYRDIFALRRQVSLFFWRIQLHFRYWWQWHLAMKFKNLSISPSPCHVTWNTKTSTISHLII
jgi:hypothetical protein